MKNTSKVFAVSLNGLHLQYIDFRWERDTSFYSFQSISFIIPSFSSFSLIPHVTHCVCSYLLWNTERALRTHKFLHKIDRIVWSFYGQIILEYPISKIIKQQICLSINRLSPSSSPSFGRSKTAKKKSIQFTYKILNLYPVYIGTSDETPKTSHTLYTKCAQCVFEVSHWCCFFFFSSEWDSWILQAKNGAYVGILIKFVGNDRHERPR